VELQMPNVTGRPFKAMQHIEAIIEAIEAGYTRKSICAKYDISYPTLTRMIAEHKGER
jgi:hypothetical protein